MYIISHSTEDLISKNILEIIMYYQETHDLCTIWTNQLSVKISDV
jgi:hypothetical protein